MAQQLCHGALAPVLPPVCSLTHLAAVNWWRQRQQEKRIVENQKQAALAAEASGRWVHVVACVAQQSGGGALTCWYCRQCARVVQRC